MIKKLQTKTLLLLALLLMGAGSAWADEVTFTAGTDTSNSSVVTKGDISVRMSALNYTDNYRCYANTDMVVKTTSGVITKVEITCTASGTSNYGPGKFKGNGYTYSGKTGTWVGSAESVTLSASAQVRMTEIVVTYTPSSDPSKTDVAVLNGISPTTLTVGDMGDFTLDATFVEGLTADEAYEVNWTSSDENILEVAGTTYEAKAVGKVNVTVSVTVLDDTKYNEVSKKFEVTVNAAPRVAAYNEVFYESFDGCNSVGGNDDSWSGINPSGTIATDNEGAWTFEKGNSANECAKFGTGSAGGSAKATLTLGAGVYTLTFKAGAWNKSGEGTTLSLGATGATLDNESVTLEMGKFTDYTATLTVATKGEVSITFSTSAGNSRFFLDEVLLVCNSLTATVTEAGWAAFVPTLNVEVPAGVNAHIVSGTTETSVELKEVLTIAAGEPVVLETAGTFAFTPVVAKDLIPAESANMLRVSDGTVGDGVYVLAKHDGKAGFYRWAGGTLAEGRVYLPADASTARSFLSFDSESTGIENVECTMNNAQVYDLQGRRVAQPQKGMYIVNGKIIIK